jgi:hypothetical protein
MRGGQP